MITSSNDNNDKKATMINVMEGLTISIGDDGLWFNFSSGKQHSSINLSYMAHSTKDIAILNWCKDIANKYAN